MTICTYQLTLFHFGNDPPQADHASKFTNACYLAARVQMIKLHYDWVKGLTAVVAWVICLILPDEFLSRGTSRSSAASASLILYPSAFSTARVKEDTAIF